MNALKFYEGTTYKTRENAVRSFLKKYDANPGFNWFIAVNTDGRFYVLCVGQKAIDAGTHFHFHTTN